MTHAKYLSAALVSIALVSGQAFASDLGGNCCADLEERIAELEATTARKGNRKVSLTIEGQINKAIYYYDVPSSSGLNSDAKIIENGNSDTFVSFRAEAKISAGWTGGGVLQIGDGHTNLISNPGGLDLKTEYAPYVRQSYVYLSGPLGKVSLGHAFDANYGITGMVTANTEVASKMLSIEPVSALHFPGTLVSLEPFNGRADDIVRYDSPSLAGLVASASWSSGSAGYDLALRYLNEAQGFRLAAGIGYSQADNDTTVTGFFSGGGESRRVLASASLKHLATGLFVSGAYGHTEMVSAGNTSAWEVQGGVENKFSTVGNATLFAEYADWSDLNLKYYGGGVVQAIDSAGLDLYATVRRYEFSTDNATTVMAGARVSF